MNDPGAYSRQDFERERDFLYRRLVVPSRLAPREQPQAVLLGGQSGAGKTTLHQILRDRFGGNVIVINGDEYRSRHPRYYELDAEYGPDAVSYTAAWSGAMTEALIDAFSDRRYNLVIEGALRTSDVPLRTASILRQKGYSVGLALMAVKPEISLVSCQIRYEQMRIAGTVPRATDSKHHRLIVDAIVDNLRVLEESGAFDEVSLYTRSRERVFPLEEQQGRDGHRANEVLRDVLFGTWTPEETKHYEQLQQLLEQLRGEEGGGHRFED